MTSPQVTLVIPTSNRPAQVARALDSVAGQTTAPHEVIVVDDGDREDGRTADLVAATVDTGLRARCVRNVGARGAAASRNFGALSANSPMVAFLDDDDELMPDSIASSLRFKYHHRSTLLTWTNALVRQFDETGAASDEWNIRFDPHALPALLECQLLAMVGLRGAEHLYDTRQQPVGTCAHVDGLSGQPHRVDADHRSKSRIQAARSLAAATGQVTVTVVSPRCSSMRMSAAMGTDTWVRNDNGKNLGAAGTSGFVFSGRPAVLPGSISVPISASLTQQRTRFALMPLAMATAADDTPGLEQAATMRALNSAL